MNEPKPFADPRPQPSREEMITAVFASMVIQSTNMAMIMLGKMAHPETGEFYREPESAKMFIDQLEMLEAKTKGNLNRQEDALLKQGLTALRVAYAELMGLPVPEAAPPALFAPEPAAEPKIAPVPAPAEAPRPSAPPPNETPPEESRKKFSKKY